MSLSNPIWIEGENDKDVDLRYLRTTKSKVKDTRLSIGKGNDASLVARKIRELFSNF